MNQKYIPQTDAYDFNTSKIIHWLENRSLKLEENIFYM